MSHIHYFLKHNETQSARKWSTVITAIQVDTFLTDTNRQISSLLSRNPFPLLMRIFILFYCPLLAPQTGTQPVKLQEQGLRHSALGEWLPCPPSLPELPSPWQSRQKRGCTCLPALPLTINLHGCQVLLASSAMRWAFLEDWYGRTAESSNIHNPLSKILPGK